MKFTQEDHFATMVMNHGTWNQKKHVKKNKFTVSGYFKDEKVEVEYRGNLCWMYKEELEVLTRENIDLNKIEFVTYREGLKNPFNVKSSLIESCVDGYEIDIIYDQEDYSKEKYREIWNELTNQPLELQVKLINNLMDQLSKRAVVTTSPSFLYTLNND